MKLLFAIKSINGEGGGAERVLVDICNGLAARGHTVEVMTFDSPGDSFYSLDARVRRIDLSVGPPGRPTPRMRFIRALPRIRRAVRSSQPDLLIPFMHSTYIPLSVALFGMGVPMVASEHTDMAHYRTRKFQRCLNMLVENFTIAKTVPAASVRKEYSSSRQSHIHVLPNPIDLNRYQGLINAPTEPPHLLSVGRLMEEKNHIDLIRAFALVSAAFPEWTLRIVGEGELRGHLESEIVRLHIQDRVFLPGVSRDVAAAYADASLVVLPSLYESFGLVAAEALASGRPVLSFDNCLGIAEMVKNEKNGILVPGEGSSAERVSNLAGGLTRLMGDPGLRRSLGQAGPASVQHYALEYVLDAWESFLLGLVERIKNPI